MIGEDGPSLVDCRLYGDCMVVLKVSSPGDDLADVEEVRAALLGAPGPLQPADVHHLLGREGAHPDLHPAEPRRPESAAVAAPAGLDARCGLGRRWRTVIRYYYVLLLYGFFIQTRMGEA